MMMHLLAASILLAAAMPPAPNTGNLLGKFLWKKRIVLIFGSTMNEHVADQVDALQARKPEADERDLIVLTIVGGIVADSGEIGLPPAQALRQRFRIDDEARFTIILVGKDGKEKLRNSEPVAASALFDLIDSMPMRRGQLRDNK